MSQRRLSYVSYRSQCRGPCWDAITTSQHVHEWDRPIWDVFTTSHWYVKKTNLRCHNGVPIDTLVRLTSLTYSRDVTARTYMRLMSLRRCSNVLVGTLKKLNYLTCRRNVLPSNQNKLTHYIDQFEPPGPFWVSTGTPKRQTYFKHLRDVSTVRK